MKNLISCAAALACLFISGCSDGTVTTDEVLGSCNLISGTYSGSYVDTSCRGDHNSGSISSFTISDGCSAQIQGFIIAANGSITNIDAEGKAFDVRAESPPGSTCGGLSGHCTQTSASPVSYDCSYSWDQGGGGSIHVVRH
ncbi:hypothetical protein [Desulfogranum mediterraneum]|uniref:hypothetical protein n=1 Tax=Desulfogranum mediterraneum TaxID=160661 RepID=UPI00041BB345|nr:hypothetical protein [Desulfogranum mediterraneum]